MRQRMEKANEAEFQIKRIKILVRSPIMMFHQISIVDLSVIAFKIIYNAVV